MERKKLESKLQQSNVRDVWSGMKKITGFKQTRDQTEGGLNRANNLSVFLKTFSSGGSTSSSSPAPSYTDLTTSLDPRPLQSRLDFIVVVSPLNIKNH